jgi:hypothetical protein
MLRFGPSTPKKSKCIELDTFVVVEHHTFTTGSPQSTTKTVLFHHVFSNALWLSSLQNSDTTPILWVKQALSTTNA